MFFSLSNSKYLVKQLGGNFEVTLNSLSKTKWLGWNQNVSRWIWLVLYVTWNFKWHVFIFILYKMTNIANPKRLTSWVTIRKRNLIPCFSCFNIKLKSITNFQYIHLKFNRWKILFLVYLFLVHDYLCI